ncbi:rho GTPase-activating protein 27 isoform X3 [Scleropages formosus]|uniref:rho GTPase-activating protein 27 isoform X3 n=1 Tax=Scleropages formosus TaxID=113540 RepID=UPI000878790F|nr:rho GTPase-activating protein 27-like isoform X3 [Scleropages formosus]
MAGMKNMGLVLVEFEFDYMDRDGDLVSIKPNERYILLSKTNDHWWQVRRDDRAKPFYIPATYVKELPSDLPLPLDFMEPASQVVAKPRHDKTVADVAGDRRDEVTIRARPQNHYKKAENRMSTFGVPLDVHGSVFHWGGLADSSVALQPHEHVPVAPGHSRDSPQHAKRSGPAPSSLLSSQSHVEDPLHLSQKSRVPGVSPTDLLVKLSQAKQVEPPVIKDVQVTPPAQECDDKAKPPAELLETTCVDSKQPEDTENIYESISDMEGLQPKNFPLSELGLFVTPPPAPAQPPPPPPSSQLQTLSNQPKLGNGTEDAVPIVKNWRHTLGPSYFAAAPEETNFVPTHRRKASDYTNELPSSGSSGELHQHTHGLEKAGIINKTKVSENGKRLRKNWSQSWTVLHDGILTFHKDPRFAPAGMSKSNQIVPEYTVDLRGATICKAPKEKSSKKNVLEIRTRNGSEYLMQYDTDTIISDWYKVIEDTIRQLDLNHHTEDDGEESSDKSSGAADKDDKDKKKIPTKQSPVASSTAAESEQGRVRNKLRKFLLRRPTLQAVKEKGYIRDNVFGCHLDTLCHRENATVPSFVEKCIASVEKRGLDIDGIYRVSGNLAVIQKLRYKADHEENLDLEDGQWEEIHVITGALKLFFRELPEPLFPFSHFDGFIAAIKLQDYSQKVSYICDLVKSLPLPNHDTMKLLFQHLRKVIEFRDVNRMSVQSVAIVFGPTLLRPETESSNITVHMVYQTQIVELILNQFEQIFQSN